jgi:transposase
LIEGVDADYLLADKGYDVQSIIDAAKKLGMEVVIPPKKNRKEQRYFDREIYRLRHLVEMLSYSSNDGVASQLATRKPPILSLPPSKFAVLPSGRRKN